MEFANQQFFPNLDGAEIQAKLNFPTAESHKFKGSLTHTADFCTLHIVRRQGRYFQSWRSHHEYFIADADILLFFFLTFSNRAPPPCLLDISIVKPPPLPAAQNWDFYPKGQG